MTRWQIAERNARYHRALNAGFPAVVSEGDSWFDYPMCLNIIDRLDDLHRWAFNRFEMCGAKLCDMIGTPRVGWSGLDALEEIVVRDRPSFVLISGGGNDLMENEVIMKCFKPYDSTQADPAWYLTATWTNTLRTLKQTFEALILRLGPHAPVFAHGYDYMIPSEKKVKYDGKGVLGPWMIEAMTQPSVAIVDPMLQRAIAKEFINQFNGMLNCLEQKYLPQFGYINLTGTLAPNDWANEIHPGEAGFKKLAKKFVKQLDLKLEPILANRRAEGLVVTE